MKKLTRNLIIMTVAFVIWMLFFDGVNYLNHQQKAKEKYKALEEQKEFYETEIVKLKENTKAMEEDPEALEKFARENYMYKKKGEEIFVIKNKKED